MSFPIVLRKTISLKDLEESYDSLLCFGMMIDMNTLKWEGQWPNSKHTSAILIILFKHDLLGPGVDKLLHLAIKLVNSFSGKGTHFESCLFEILSNTLMSIW